MALEQKLSLKLSQKLVMTPSLQQAIKLLQMTRLELEGVLTKELVENPVLEEMEVTPEEERADERDSAEGEDALSDIDLDAYFEEYAESYERTQGQASTYEERQGPPLENTLSEEDDLYDNLLWQLHMMDLPPLLREIAELIIGNLDEDGFLAATIEEIQRMGADGWSEGWTRAAPVDDARSAEAEPPESAADAPPAAEPPPEPNFNPASVDPLFAFDLGPPSDLPPVAPAASHDGEASPAASDGDTPSDEPTAAVPDEPADTEPDEPVEGYPRMAVEAALDLVRSLDPPGVACRDLREALLLQLDRDDEPEDSLARRLIDEHWDLFRRRKFEQIAKELEISLAELKPVVELIAGLDTRPGRKFSTDKTQYVEPDVHIVRVGEDYVVQLNDNGLPRLRVSRAYRRMLQGLRQQGSEAEAQAYIKDKMRSALWLIKSLDQRQRTIHKVANSIIKQQRGFFDYGVEHLRPMVLRDVAEDIEMHESTVSRVVSNKYMHTPRGLLPMKFFFHSGIDREYGEDISSLTVKRKIRNMIQDEDPKKPLADSAIMRTLNREGIKIARRTVAKYRDELGIASSTERKKIF